MKSQAFKENKDFRRLYYRGRNVASPVLVTYAIKTKGKSCRIGITTSKKIGGAVERNRSRRVIRAAYAGLEDRINGCWDFVFVARSRTSQVKMQEVQEAMAQHFAQLGVMDGQD